jgi:hypothetical protein
MLTLLRRACLVAGVLGGVGLLPTWAAAHGGDTSLLHACVQVSSGQLRLVMPDETCRPTEVPVDWPLSAAAAAAPSGPQVADATGAIVGPVVGTNGPVGMPAASVVLVGVPLGTGLAVVPMGPRGYAGEDALLYESSDCTGTPYLFTPAAGLLNTAVADLQGMVYADAGQAGIVLTVHSYTLGTFCVANQSFPGVTAIPTAAVLDLRSFTAPFHLQ